VYALFLSLPLYVATGTSGSMVSGLHVLSTRRTCILQEGRDKERPECAACPCKSVLLFVAGETMADIEMMQACTIENTNTVSCKLDWIHKVNSCCPECSYNTPHKRTRPRDQIYSKIIAGACPSAEKRWFQLATTLLIKVC
jgi:hypothetical protein